MTYLFIFGKNPALAKAELFTILGSLELKFEVAKDSSQFVAIEFSAFETVDGLPFDSFKLIRLLGGTIRIAKEITADSFEEAVVQNDIFLPKKFNFSFVNFENDHSGEKEVKTEDYWEKEIVKYFKQNKFRALRKRSKNVVPTPSEYYSWKLNEGAEFFKIDRNLFLSEACPDPKQFREADQGRPERLFTHGTSPRLARIMTNILNPKSSDVVVDPFCGTGTFLIELLARGISSVGIDNDPQLVKIAEINVDWAKKKFQSNTKVQVLYADSTNASFKANHCVFEPYMGPFLKIRPNDELAKKIVNELYNLYSSLFLNLSNNLAQKAHVVCIIPYFVSQSGKTFEIDESFFLKSGFRIDSSLNNYGIKFPLIYSTPKGNKIGRKLYKLTKQSN